MKIAVISDIHSNIYALEAVLDDMKKRYVDLIACTGDLVGYGTRPNEVINTIREHKIITIMGNYDDAIGNYKIVCGCDYPDPKDAQKVALSMQFTSSETTDENSIDCKSSVKIEIIEVDYDFEKAAREIEENDVLPNDFARLIREGSSK